VEIDEQSHSQQATGDIIGIELDRNNAYDILRSKLDPLEFDSEPIYPPGTFNLIYGKFSLLVSMAM